MSDDLRPNLFVAAYEGIAFPLTELHTSSGHDRALHQSFLRPGADVQTTGRKPRMIKCKAAFINTLSGWPANLWPDRFRELSDKLASTPIGTFYHPVHSKMRVHVDEVGEPVEAKLRNGVYVELTFLEDGDPAQLVADQTAVPAADPATDMAKQAEAADAAASTAGVTGYVPVLPTVNTALDFLESGRRSNLELGSSILSVTALVVSNLALASMDVLAAHDCRVGLEATRAASYAYRDAYFGDAKPTQYVVGATMSLARIAALVYGDAQKAYLLRLANQIPDPLFVPRGTVLTVMPSLS